MAYSPRDAEPNKILGAEILTFLHGKISDSNFLEIEQKIRQLAGMDTQKPADERTAADARPRYAMDSRDPVTRMQDIGKAERAVAPHVGEILGMDSAATVFREALKRLGTDASGLAASALPEMFRLTVAANRPGGARPRTDAAASRTLDQRFPSIARVRTV
jgi:hypothetical protein